METGLASKRVERVLREVNVPYLVGDKREALAQFLARLEAEHGDAVRRVILFGSYARGDADAESDIDVLIVARGEIENVRRVYHWCKENRTDWVSTLVISEEDYHDDQRLRVPFYVNVRREGIELWDPEARQIEERDVPLNFIEGEFRVLDYETIETIRIYLSNMKEQLEDVALMEKMEHWRGAVSHLYYAAFYVTTAALYTLNVVRGKHKGVYDAVNEFLVKHKLLEEEYGKLYERLMEGRLNVDYRPQKIQKHEKILTDEELEQLVLDGKRYIERMKQFLIERGVDKTDFDA